MSTCLISLGSNLGDRASALQQAVQRLGEHPQIDITAVSRWRSTQPVGGPVGQNEFLNGALRLETNFPPRPLLELLQQTEQHLGRQPSARWGPRSIDLDLLLYGELVIQEEPSLLLPHPRMAFRRFVLEPAVEVAAEMVHPQIGWTMRRLLDHLDNAASYIAIGGPPGVGKTRLARDVLKKTAGQLIAEPMERAPLDLIWTEPTGQLSSVEIQYLHCRAALLGKIRQNVDDLFSISDFWLDESIILAEQLLTGQRLQVFREAFHQTRQAAVTPKLLILLDLSSEELVRRGDRHGQSDSELPTTEWFDRFRHGLSERATRPAQSPVLRLGAEDPDHMLAEVTAAIQAMQL